MSPLCDVSRTSTGNGQYAGEKTGGSRTSSYRFCTVICIFIVYTWQSHKACDEYNKTNKIIWFCWHFLARRKWEMQIGSLVFPVFPPSVYCKFILFLLAVKREDGTNRVISPVYGIAIWCCGPYNKSVSQ